MQRVSAAGDLAVFSIANVLQFLAASSAGGVLRLYRGNDRASLWFDGGAIVAATVAEAGASPRSPLITANASEAELEELVFSHVSRVLAAVIAWHEGHFTFVAEAATATREARRIAVDRALMTAAWVADEERRAG